MSQLPLPPGVRSVSRPPMMPPPAPPASMTTDEEPMDMGGADLSQEFVADMPIQASYVTICSIWPMSKESVQFAHGGKLKTYRIEAGSLEKPSYLRIYNTYTLTQNINRVEDGDPAQMARAVNARQLAQNDLVGYWTGNTLVGHTGRIGIFVCQSDRATPAELQNAKREQESFCKAQIQNADEQWFGGKRGFPLTEARRAAIWMKDTDQKRHPWFSDVGFDSTRECPKCGDQVSTARSFCKGCSTNVAEYLMERSRPAPENWAAVKEEMEFLAKKAGA